MSQEIKDDDILYLFFFYFLHKLLAPFTSIPSGLDDSLFVKRILRLQHQIYIQFLVVA